MAYTPNPADPTQPVETVFASTAAAEFRALKQYVQNLVAGQIVLGSDTRNQFRNPAWKVNQRSSGVVTANTTFIADGWKLSNLNAVRISGARYFDSPEVGSGGEFIVTATGAPAGTDTHGFYTFFEGRDFDQNKFGTVNARGLVLSFDVFSQVAGTFSIAFRNAAQDRSYVTTFQVNNVNTVEHKTIVIPGDLTGTWPTAEVPAASLQFTLAGGPTTRTAILNQWQAGNFSSAANATQFTSSANGTTMRIMNLQLEAGAVATPFTALPYALEVARCQRYYETGRSDLTGYQQATGALSTAVYWKVTKRAVPTLLYAALTNVNTAVFDIRTPTVSGATWFCQATAVGAVQWIGTWTADADM